MSLLTVYLQHRMQLLERYVGTLVQMMKLRHRVDAYDEVDMKCVWQADLSLSNRSMSTPVLTPR